MKGSQGEFSVNYPSYSYFCLMEQLDTRNNKTSSAYSEVRKTVCEGMAPWSCVLGSNCRLNNQKKSFDPEEPKCLRLCPVWCSPSHGRYHDKQCHTAYPRNNGNGTAYAGWFFFLVRLARDENHTCSLGFSAYWTQLTCVGGLLMSIK